MYITVDEVRDQDPTGQGYSSWTDKEIEDLILKWQGIIEKELQQWFESRDKTIELKGSGTRILHLFIPIIDITELYLNEDTVALDPTFYRAYKTADVYPDDRPNPKIELISDSGSIYTSLSGIFETNKIQKLIGQFGYVDNTGNTPEAVKHALILVVTDHMGSKYITDPVFKKMATASKVVQEKLDKYSYKLSDAATSGRGLEARLYSVLGNREAAILLTTFFRPIAVAYTGDPDVPYGNSHYIVGSN
jgi:hypothetical protein